MLVRGAEPGRLQAGVDYVVYAIQVAPDGTWFYLADAGYTSYPMRHPAAQLEVVDARVSRHWSYGRSLSGDAVFAPAEWATDPGFYEGLVDGEATAGRPFAEAKASMDLEFARQTHTRRVDDVGDGWVLCPECDEAWAAEGPDELARCPRCGLISRR